MIAGAIAGGRPYTPTGGGDPYWSSVVLLLYMDGTNGSTVFTDEKGHAVTAEGGASISTAQSKFGGASCYMDGAGGYLTTPTSADFRFRTADFTVEGWFRPSAIGSYGDLFSTGEYDADQLSIRITDAGKLQAYCDGGSDGIGIMTSSSSFASGSWSHFAVSRISGVTRLFLDGALEASSSGTSDINCSTGTVRIGKQVGASSFDLAGYVDMIRVTKGVGRYAAAFTPPAVQFPNS